MRTKFLFIMCTISIQLSAQQPAEHVRLNDCIALALGKNPALQISQARIQAAEARSSEAGTALLPQLKLTGRAAELSKVDAFSLSLPPPIGSMTLFPSITENYSIRISLQQPLFTGFKLSKGQEMAELNASATREDMTKDQADLVFNVITAYWNLYRTIKIEEVIRQSVEQMSEHLRNVSKMASQGMATESEVLRIKVQLSDVKVRLLEAKNSIHLAAMSLNSMVSNALSTEILPIDSPVVPLVVARTFLDDGLQQLQNIAHERRPELKSMQLRRQVNSAGVGAAKGGWYPQVFLAANYEYSNPNQRIIPPKEQWDGTWDIGISLQWNLWDWNATRHQTVQAEAALRQTEAGLAQLTDAVTLDVTQQYYSAQTAIEKVEVTRDGVLQAQESHRMTTEKFKNGLASNADVLDAEVALLQARLAFTQATVEYTIAQARLKKATGELQ
jgi:outer membrane protein